MSFRIRGLSPEPFQPFFGLSQAELDAHSIHRVVAEEGSSYPDRIEMRHAKPGETLLLLNHTYQPAQSPYHGTHAIFVIEGATETFDAVDNVPEVMTQRLLALRGYDERDMIADGRVIPGTDAAEVIEDMLSNPKVRYIHAHNAAHGCYSGLIERA